MADDTCPHRVPRSQWCPSCMSFTPVHALALALGLLAGSCVRDVPPTPGPGGDGCEAACANLALLACPWATAVGPDDQPGTADDIACERWCADYEREGVDLHTSCVSSAATCESADACGGAP